MSSPLIEAVKELNLQPGQSRLFSVNGYLVEIRRVEEKAEEESDCAHMVMQNMFLDIPPSPAARTIIAHRGTILPTPQIFDESDLAPE